MVFWSFSALGEEWTEGQKEVWSCVESFWEQVTEGNKAGIEEGIHGEAIGWETNKETPLRKPEIMASYLGWIQYAIPVTYQLKLYSIQILGDIANVIYAAKWKAKKNLRQLSYINLL